MSDLSKYVAVKSDHPDHEQGYYLMAEWDFDAEKGHVLYEGETILTPKVPTATALPPLPDALPPVPADADPLANLSPDWKSQDAASLKALALAVSGRSVDNKAQAIDVVNAALAARTAA